jgi:enoyl-CoA hydratase
VTGGDPVVVEVDGRVMTITITRPDVRNAIDRATSDAMAAALDELDDREDLSVGIVTGGGGTFSAGMDLKAFLRGENPSHPVRGFAGLIRKLPMKPMIAAIEGYALAGGFEIMLACDLVVAAEDAVFGLPEVRRGLTPNGGGMLRLPRRVPTAVAMELVLTGETISAVRAKELGLVNTVTPKGHALDGARHLAARIAANGPLAVATAKQVMVESAEWSAAEMFALQEPFSARVRESVDAKEGASAFAEKRAPIWRGR